MSSTEPEGSGSSYRSHAGQNLNSEGASGDSQDQLSSWQKKLKSHQVQRFTDKATSGFKEKVLEALQRAQAFTYEEIEASQELQAFEIGRADRRYVIGIPNEEFADDDLRFMVILKLITKLDCIQVQPSSGAYTKPHEVTDHAKQVLIGAAKVIDNLPTAVYDKDAWACKAHNYLLVLILRAAQSNGLLRGIYTQLANEMVKSMGDNVESWLATIKSASPGYTYIGETLKTLFRLYATASAEHAMEVLRSRRISSVRVRIFVLGKVEKVKVGKRRETTYVPNYPRKPWVSPWVSNAEQSIIREFFPQWKTMENVWADWDKKSVDQQHDDLEECLASYKGELKNVQQVSQKISSRFYRRKRVVLDSMPPGLTKHASSIQQLEHWKKRDGQSATTLRDAVIWHPAQYLGEEIVQELNGDEGLLQSSDSDLTTLGGHHKRWADLVRIWKRQFPKHEGASFRDILDEVRNLALGLDNMPEAEANANG